MTPEQGKREITYRLAMLKLKKLHEDKVIDDKELEKLGLLFSGRPFCVLVGLLCSGRKQK